MAKTMIGTYEVYYRMWKIKFPYWTKYFLHAGSKKDAVAFASKYKKQKKIPYTAKITEVKF